MIIIITLVSSDTSHPTVAVVTPKTPEMFSFADIFQLAMKEYQ
jgi:hypothetical protein